jgi:hypothetical protein
MRKLKKENGPENREEKEVAQLIASSFPKLTAGELFRLAAYFEVRSAKSKETGPPDTVSYPYVE